MTIEEQYTFCNLNMQNMMDMVGNAKIDQHAYVHTQA